MHHLSIDLETYSSVPIAKAGAQKYISSPDFEILLFAYSVDGAPVEIIDLARGERLPPWLVQAITSYNKIVVFIDRSPAECYNSFRVLWIGEALLPQRRFLGGSNHSFFVEMLIS